MLFFKVVFEDDILVFIKDDEYLSDLCSVKFVCGIVCVLFICEGEKGCECYGDFVIVFVLVYFVSWMWWVFYVYDLVLDLCKVYG